MHSPDSMMEYIIVKGDQSEPSDSTELGHPSGLWDEVTYDIPLKADPEHPPAEYESTRLIGADLSSSTLTRSSAEVKPWLGKESKDAPTSGNTKDVPSPKMYINHCLASLCGEVGARPTPLHSAKSLPFRSASKRKFHECTGLSYQIDPIVPQYEADPYGSGGDILNDPLKPDPDDTSAEYGPSGLNETDPSRSNALPVHDEVKKEEIHDDPYMASMVTNDSSDLKYDDVAEDPTNKVFAREETLSKEPTISGIVGARTDLQMIGKNPPSTSAPRRNSFEPLPLIMGASAKSVRIKKAPAENTYGSKVGDYRAARAPNLKRHMATHTGEKPYGCDVCDYRAAQAITLRKHMATHTGEKPYGCDVCDYRAVQASQIKTHMATHTDEKPYACDVCDYRTALAPNLKRHMATHTGEKLYACDLCDYRAVQALHLKSHMATHTDEKPYACDVCDYRAARASQIKIHMATHTGEKPYACDVCDYISAQATNLKRHMATHTGEKFYACDLCDYRAVQASHLKRHMATHTGEKFYACDLCDYRAVQAPHLKSHKATHTGENLYACHVCDYRVTMASHLKKHIMAAHTGKKPYFCDVCDYRAARPSQIKTHMATHTGEKPYACDVCDYRAVQAVHLKRHMATHTGEKPYACDLCDYRAPLASQVKAHMATHTGEKPYGCDVCDYRAAQAYNLREHMATHADEKLYGCDVCDYRATRAIYLKKHMATHTGEKPYGCDVCDYRAALASALKRHMATHTGEKPYGCNVCDYRATRASYLKRHMATHTGVEASDGCSWVPQCSDAGMMSSDTVGTSKADNLMAGPSHRVYPIVDHHDEDPYKLSANSNLNFPLKHDPDDPSADYGSSSSMTTDLHRSDPLLGHDEVMTEWLLEVDVGLCDPLDVSAHQQPTSTIG